MSAPRYHIGAPMGKQGRSVYLGTRRICVAKTRLEARLIMVALNDAWASDGHTPNSDTQKRDKGAQ